MDGGAARVERRPQQLARPLRRPVGCLAVAGEPGHGLIELEHAGLGAGADVHQQPAALLGGPHEGVDDVVDEHVVARLAAVAEDGGLLPGQHEPGEDRHHPGLTVGVLARTVDVGERQLGVLQPAHLAVVVQVVARRLLRHAVGRDRPLRMALAHGQALGHPVERAPRPREHDLAGARGERRLADVERAEHVDLGIEQRLRHRHAHVELGREMEDHFGFAVGDDVDQLR